MFYSIVIPVYNRPQEIRELLQSLTRQTFKNFEVLVIEDGSDRPCKEIVHSFSDTLDISYHYKKNTGQGFSRNYGFERAKGDYYIVFDSDCIIPSHYLSTVDTYLQNHHLDAFGGPDKAHHSFTTLQKAISYSMTSPFTTGGIRGNKRHAGTFHPRSFNMGISREVFEKTGGYRITRMGEDLEFSIRIIERGFRTGLITEAYVYHKRRTSLAAFFKQLHFFGKARINVSRFYPSEVKFIHSLPALFTIGLIIYATMPFWSAGLFLAGTGLLLLFCISIAAHATKTYKSLAVGFLSVITSLIQITAYGLGFLYELSLKLTE